MTVPHPGEAAHTKGLPIVATLGALGVVYGDIGTSPLYALKEAAKAAAHGGPLIHEATLGVVSLILWALILIISVKYALLILRADNRGEGGIVALLALLHARNAQPGTWRAQLLVVGLVGAALLGIHGIVQAPGVLVAVSPLYAFDFLIHRDFHISFAVLGAAFLAVTGGEAMYADMGHF